MVANLMRVKSFKMVYILILRFKSSLHATLLCIALTSDMHVSLGLDKHYKSWKVTFTYSETVLRYYIDQTFLDMFRSDLLQAYNNWDTDQNARYYTLSQLNNLHSNLNISIVNHTYQILIYVDSYS